MSGASDYSTLAEAHDTYGEMSAPPTLPARTSQAPSEYEYGTAQVPSPYEHPESVSRQPSYEAPVPASQSSESVYDSPAAIATQEIYDSLLEDTVDSMQYHPMVEASACSVVILAGTESDGKAPKIVSDLLADLRSKKVKTWDFAGRWDDNLVSLMRFILQKCATILVVVTDTFSKSQAPDFISYTKTVRDFGKSVFAIKGQANSDMDEGILGLHFDEFFDLSMDPARGADQRPKTKAFRRELDKIVKVCTKNAAEATERRFSMPMRRTSSADMARSSGSLKTATSKATFDPKKIMDPQGQAEAAKGRVLLLYSWGRKGKKGLYDNQQKVLVVKNQLMSRGYKVWMDIDHPASEGSKGNFDDIMALAIYNSWVVVACVSNSFHLPDSPVNHAFIFALDKKQPGVSLFAMKLGKNTDMQAGVYGLYMNMQLYYDASMLDPNDGYDMNNLKACAISVGQMTNDIVLVNPPESQEESLYGTAGDEGINGAAEEIYCVANLASDDTVKLSPAVKASKDAIMLSYSWGANVGGAWPNREDVLALKDVLQRRGYKCWIDLDWMMGNMDKVMAGVIENSAVVLACIHPEYNRVGGNAHKEWVYTCKKKVLGTDFLPLLMVPEAKVPEVVLRHQEKKATVKKAMMAATKGTIDISGLILGAKCGCGPDWTDESSAATQQLIDALEAAGVRKFETLFTEPSVEGAMNRQRAVRGTRGSGSRDSWGSHGSGSGKGPNGGGHTDVPLPLPPRAPTVRKTASSGSQPVERHYSVPADVVAEDKSDVPIPEQFRSHAAFIGKKMHKDDVNDLFERKSSLGEFVIRESDRHAGAFVIVINDGSGVRQRKIGIEHDKILINAIQPGGASETKIFTSLAQLLKWLEVGKVPSYVFEFMAQHEFTRKSTTNC